MQMTEKQMEDNEAIRDACIKAQQQLSGQALQYEMAMITYANIHYFQYNKCSTDDNNRSNEEWLMECIKICEKEKVS